MYQALVCKENMSGDFTLCLQERLLDLVRTWPPIDSSLLLKLLCEFLPFHKLWFLSHVLIAAGIVSSNL